MHYSKNLAESLRSFSSQVHYLCLLGEGSWGGATGAAEQTGSMICWGSRCRRNQPLLRHDCHPPPALLPSSVTVSLPPPPAQLRRWDHCRGRSLFLITGKALVFTQSFKSILKKVKLSDTNSTSRKDPGLTPLRTNLEQPHWLRCSLPTGAVSSASVFTSSTLASEIYLSSPVAAFICPNHLRTFQSLPPPTGILPASTNRNFTIWVFIS